MHQHSLLNGPQALAKDLWLLPGLADSAMVLPRIRQIAAQRPFRRMPTRSGHLTAAAMSHCGAYGWTLGEQGYAYHRHRGDEQPPVPAIPPDWLALAAEAAARAGYADYRPDVCLINRYGAGDGMGRHRDDSEADLRQPIVSVSLGLPARFAWWGVEGRGRGREILLQDGDVLVWGGSARLGYHGVRPVAAGRHPLSGPHRYNLTFRVAGPPQA
ncbi:alpha-ketoglutarate-dependent dioxygenase AlkB [Alkalilimnicola sp. S0819]|uniref:alpha-ketoglutarate-dependent dioxygenase AlkB n=1 Tax=Alkalilimnicola sp. S0819 TaxID=2613922 RepID=UPI0012624C58|nr:alpha-ketoglutarate-dependent dioxygenase AlkB [Alkalilimnicola sp. S0819]KAB7623913.1 hypothetical protein F3N43_07650 [Alkalilimnicola sp. S0819]MPQ16509.1 hypothetical protein [Alkalilimnicola sp. S0819]